MNEALKLCAKIMNEFTVINEDLYISDVKIVDYEVPIVKEVYKQSVDEDTVYLEDYVYVKQYNPFEDFYHGMIAHKIKNSDYWIVCTYEA